MSNLNYQLWLKDAGMNLFPSESPAEKRDNENGILFAYVFYLLKKNKNKLSNDEEKFFKFYFWRVCNSLGLGLPYGLYNRGQDEHITYGEDCRTISHDNLTAIACAVQSEAKAIFHYGIRNFWCFNNVGKREFKLSRVLHPRDIIFYSYVGGNCFAKFLATLFLPFFYFTQFLILQKNKEVRPMWYTRIISKIKKIILKKDDGLGKIKEVNRGESGKQLLYVRMHKLVELNAPLSKAFMGYANKKITNNFGSWDNVFVRYYTKWGVSCEPILELCGYGKGIE